MNAVDDLIKNFFAPKRGGASAGFILAFAAVLAAYAVTVCSPPAFEPLYSIYLDTVSFYWIQALWDKGLFSGDLLVSVYLSYFKSFHPESLWVWPTALFMKVSPYSAGLKALSVLACAASALMIRRLALASRAGPAAFAAALLFTVVFLSMDTFFGVPRVYGGLLFIGFALIMEEKRFLWLPALVALCFVFYPAASVGLAISSALVPFFYRAEFSSRRLFPRYLAALAAGAALSLLVFSHSGMTAAVSPGGGKVAAFQSAKLYQMVAVPVDPAAPADVAAYFVLNINEHGRLYTIFIALLALVCAAGFIVSPGRPAMLPRSVPVLLAGCALAFLLLYRIHPVSASRQLIFIVPLLLVFLSAEGLLRIFGDRFRPAAAAAVCGALFAGLHPWFNQTVSMRRYAGVYQFLAKQPGGAPIAGYPESDLVLTVPVYARKSVLLSAETADQELMFVTGPEDYARRRRAILEALYCARPGAGKALASSYAAGWLIFEKKYYTAEFLSEAANSEFPRYAELAGLLAGAADPAGCYSAAREKAAFSWGGESGGFVLDLSK